jgi:hypothetical protein
MQKVVPSYRKAVTITPGDHYGEVWAYGLESRGQC